MEIQVKKEHYDFNKYVGLDRWNSYYYQISEVIKCKGNSVLLIGVGDGIVVDVLRHLNRQVTTFDFDKSLNPDIVGDVTKIDEIITKKYDIIICCQVLEHIPFEKFEPTIEKISKITNNLILSLPNKNIRIKYRSFCPILRNIKWKFKCRFFWQNNRDFNKDGYGEHYWEIDAKPKRKLKNIEHVLDNFFKHRKTFISFTNTYHIFFILQKD